MARRYHCRPSEILQIEDPFLAVAIDTAAEKLGREHDRAEVQSAIRSGKVQMVVDVGGN